MTLDEALVSAHKHVLNRLFSDTLRYLRDGSERIINSTISFRFEFPAGNLTASIGYDIERADGAKKAKLVPCARISSSIAAKIDDTGPWVDNVADIVLAVSAAVDLMRQQNLEY